VTARVAAARLGRRSGVALPPRKARDLGPPPQLKFIPVAKCRVDAAYQRTVASERSRATVARIAHGFDWRAFGAVIAGRDGAGGYVVPDGQHRIEAARSVGLKTVPACVFASATQAELAAAFVAANRDRVAVHPFALHRAQLCAKQPEARAIDALCRAAGVALPAFPVLRAKLKPGQTLALGTLAALLRAHGPAGALLAVGAAAAAWRGKAGALSAAVLKASAAAIAPGKPGAAQRAAALGAWLETRDPAALEGLARRRAQDGQLALAQAYGRLFVEGRVFDGAPAADPAGSVEKSRAADPGEPGVRGAPGPRPIHLHRRPGVKGAAAQVLKICERLHDAGKPIAAAAIGAALGKRGSAVAPPLSTLARLGYLEALPRDPGDAKRKAAWRLKCRGDGAPVGADAEPLRVEERVVDGQRVSVKIYPARYAAPVQR
jgi:hypothetical protein